MSKNISLPLIQTRLGTRLSMLYKKGITVQKSHLESQKQPFTIHKPYQRVEVWAPTKSQLSIWRQSSRTVHATWGIQAREMHPSWRKLLDLFSWENGPRNEGLVLQLSFFGSKWSARRLLLYHGVEWLERFKYCKSSWKFRFFTLFIMERQL